MCFENPCIWLSFCLFACVCVCFVHCKRLISNILRRLSAKQTILGVQVSILYKRSLDRHKCNHDAKVYLSANDTVINQNHIVYQINITLIMQILPYQPISFPSTIRNQASCADKKEIIIRAHNQYMYMVLLNVPKA